MIDVEEHRYDDDPSQGPPDGKTLLAEVSYFFVGNGLIQGAVQVALGGEGTPLGLLIWDPEKLQKKRQALSFDPETGLKDTLLCVGDQETEHLPGGDDVKACWDSREGIPMVRAEWSAGPVSVREEFFCPDSSLPRLARILKLRNHGNRPLSLRLSTGIRGSHKECELVVPSRKEACAALVYSLDTKNAALDFRFREAPAPHPDRIALWRRTTQASFGSPLLDRFFQASKNQLDAVTSREGRMDASIWQYNREWLRDHVWVSLGFLLCGRPERARFILERLLQKFVTPQGDAIDSGEFRQADEVELDQNGELLYVLERYTCWTGDRDLLERYWHKVRAAAEFPLQDRFRHLPSGLLQNVREYWERHSAFGITPGVESAHQTFAILGLAAAARMADLLGNKEEARRWMRESERLHRAAFDPAGGGLVEEGRLIKRRSATGEAGLRIQPGCELELPAGSPLGGEGDHLLEPDTSSALPIAFELVPPDSSLAANTIAALEELWAQAWKGGGYGRYHCSSEPDAWGPWPFPSLFVARACLEARVYTRAWRVLRWLDSVPGAASGSWFEFYGQAHSPPFAQIGIPPWTWSEVLLLLIHHLAGIRPAMDRLCLRPRLLPGLERIQITIPVRDFSLHLTVQAGEQRQTVFRTDAQVLNTEAEKLEIAYPGRDISVEAEVCYST